MSAAVLFALPLAAQNVAQQDQYDPKAIIAAERYQKPPAIVEKLVAANRSANITLTNPSPDHKTFLKLDSDGLPSLEDFAKGHIYLGGLQVDTMAFRVRTLTTRGAHSITLVDAMTGKTRTLEAPAGADVSSPTWSPDGKTIAYIASFPKASQIMLLDVASGKSTQLTKTQLNAVYQTGIDFTTDGKSIITVLVPQPFKPAPAMPAVATTPIVRMTTDGTMDKEPGHASLMTTPHEKDLLEYYATGQLAVIDVKTKAVTLVGKPAMIRSVNSSPDGKYFRVTLMDKPFSYVVPSANFGTEEQLWDATGQSCRANIEAAAAHGVAHHGFSGGAGRQHRDRKRRTGSDSQGQEHSRMESERPGDARRDHRSESGLNRPGGGSGRRAGRSRGTWWTWQWRAEEAAERTSRASWRCGCRRSAPMTFMTSMRRRAGSATRSTRPTARRCS